MIGEELPQLPGWLGLSPYALIVAMILFYTIQLTREKLFTRGQHLSIVNPLKETITKQDELIRELTWQNSVLLNGGQITSSFFQKIPVQSPHDEVEERTQPKRPQFGAQWGREREPS